MSKFSYLYEDPTSALQVTGSTPISHAKGWTIQCPAHADGSPSLSVRENDAGTKLLVNCYAGCSVHDICGSLGIRVGQLFFSRSENFVPTTKYEREGLELDRTVCWLFHARRENRQSCDFRERRDFEAAAQRVRRHDAGQNRRKIKK